MGHGTYQFACFWEKFRSLLHQLTRSVSFRLCRRKLRLQHLWHVLLGLWLLLYLHVVHRSLPFRIGSVLLFSVAVMASNCALASSRFCADITPCSKSRLTRLYDFFSNFYSGFGFLPHFVGSLQLLLAGTLVVLFSFKACAVCSAACA